MSQHPDDGPVVFRSTRGPRRSLPLAIERRTLGIMLIVWSLVSIANESVSIQVVFFAPPVPGHGGSLLGMFQTTPFPWLWYSFLGPICLITFALLVIAGSILMAVGREPGRALTAGGLVLSLGAELVGLVAELASLKPPFQFPWQLAVTQAGAAVVVGGALYLVVAAAP